MITVTMACGCRSIVEATGTTAPYCSVHHEARVQRVSAPPPRITTDCGATGPYVVKE